MISLDLMTHSVRNQGKLADQRTVISFREQGRDKLAYWLGNRFDQLGFLTMSGISYQTAQSIHLTYQEVLNDSIKERARLAYAAAAAAQRNAGWLRDQLREADVRIATASSTAVRDYAATANQLLGQCSQRYTELASKADGHAVDARTCRAAWPVIHAKTLAPAADTAAKEQAAVADPAE